jgi:ribosome maturation factor RimP
VYTLPNDIQDGLNDRCQQYNVMLLDVVIRGTRERRIIEIYVDTPDGVTLDQCSTLSTIISDFFESQKVFTGNYRLDVSSPGVDRPLQFLWQYPRNIGRLLTVTLLDGVVIKGNLKRVTEDSIVIEREQLRSKGKKYQKSHHSFSDSRHDSSLSPELLSEDDTSRIIAYAQVKQSVVEIVL